jgi:hypothetical protein
MATPSDAPLDPWKKRSGFKKGLRTDIVLGDSVQYTRRHGQLPLSTMKADYHGAQSADAAQDQPATPEHLLAGTWASKARLLAGTSISFGDQEKMTSATSHSITSTDYTAHTPTYDAPGQYGMGGKLRIHPLCLRASLAPCMRY